MSESGKYEKVPRPESVKALIQYLSSNPLVLEVEHLSEQKIIVRRIGKSDLQVFMTNVYIVGISDVHDILSVAPDVNAIVTMSAWNGYTQDAKDSCKRQKIGLFLFAEFLGAAYYDGDKFFNYTTPDKSKKDKK
ncbi:MAG: hypothetical protein IH589_11290 [Anaerolineales bacterium]|nr:hypothetical protein [Anaerolineales bacterium]